ncbi:hypothetical protein H5410_036111 [Solanum commersonii]|uniref:Uncharacterized protein n=1 Tax=Solanum commersonii TaxID=4109 RepID=A0A9J5Y4Q1_SOLCO|nr:hypothetical protein H5410_036111 [Solanum commersonii]
MHTTRLNLLMQGSIVYSKIQIVTHHHQRFLFSQYLLLVQVQAQQKYLNALAQRMIPYSHTYMSQFKIRNQIQRSHSKRGTQCILLKIKKVFLRLVTGLSAKIKNKLKCKYKKVIADKLDDLIGKSPNLFGEPKQARRRDWLNNEEKIAIEPNANQEPNHWQGGDIRRTAESFSELDLTCQSTQRAYF